MGDQESCNPPIIETKDKPFSLKNALAQEFKLNPLRFALSIVTAIPVIWASAQYIDSVRNPPPDYVTLSLSPLLWTENQTAEGQVTILAPSGHKVEVSGRYFGIGSDSHQTAATTFVRELPHTPFEPYRLSILFGDVPKYVIFCLRVKNDRGVVANQTFAAETNLSFYGTRLKGQMFHYSPVASDSAPVGKC